MLNSLELRTDILARICTEKLAHIERRKEEFPQNELEKIVLDSPLKGGFIKNIRDKIETGSPALIAEIKKASPSKGIIREDFNPVEIARAYESAGASCLSILTDEPYFQGRDEYLAQIRDAASLPVLRKDFMLDPYQIYESRLLGADCILLIMAALDNESARHLYHLATDLGMDVLVEVHNLEELERAMVFTPAMIGVNSRNLKTLEVNLDTARDLGLLIPGEIVKVAESGIYTHDDLQSLHQAGYHAFLVGESLMREKDVAHATKKLLGTI